MELAQTSPSSPPAIEREQLSDGFQRVIVTLQAPAVSHSSPAATAAEQAAIQRVQDAVIAAYPASELRVTHRYRTVPAFAASVPPQTLDALRRNPNVRSVDIDELAELTLAEGRALIGADEVHAAGVTGAGVTVAVIDTGADSDHPDLVDDLVGGKCFVAPDGCPGGLPTGDGLAAAEDLRGHGTSVTGIITSAGVVAPLGVAPDAEIWVYNVFGPYSGAWFSDILAALDDINANRPEVSAVNMSLGTSPYPGACDFNPLTGVTASLRARGTLVFAASGNSASSAGISAPACISDIISVGAVYDADDAFGFIPRFGLCAESSLTAADQITCYSNSTTTLDGNGEPLLDVLAPSHCATTSSVGGGTTPCFGGTSTASPYAAATAALLLSADSSLTADEVEGALESTGVPIVDLRNGVTTPRIDALAAVAPVLTQTLTVTKLVVNDDGGTSVVSDFTLRIDGAVVASGVPRGIAPGLHTVSEDDPGFGYASVIGGDCAPDGSILLAADQHATCTITNDDQISTLTVTKIVVNDDGGTGVVADFTLLVDGASVVSSVPVALVPGSHTVSEVDPGGGYAAVISGDCAADGSIALVHGQIAECTITNDDAGPPQVSPFTPTRTDDPEPNGCFENDCSLREAVDAANAATGAVEIVVPPGTYRLTIPGPGSTDDDSLSIIRDVTIIGAGAASTVIDGGALGTVFYVREADLNLSGVTITGGRASFGAGIQFSLAGGNITDNVFVGNVQTAGGYGAAIGGSNSSPTIERNLFRDNSCDDQSGAGVVSFANASLPRIANNVFVDNPCRAIDISMPTSAGPTVVNNTIVRNRTGIRFGAIVGGEPKSFRNNLIVENEIGLDANLGDTIWEHNLVFGNGVDYQGVADQTELNGNLSVDPLLVDQASGDFHLHAGSPAVDAGSSEGAPTDDFDGTPRPRDGDLDSTALVDIGAFEFEASAAATLTVTKVVVNDDGGTALVGDFTLRVDGTVVASTVATTLAAGLHTVSEDDPGFGYSGVIGGDCAPDGSITLAADQSATCTITNDDGSATLTVTKVVVNDSGRTAVVGDFTLRVDGAMVTSGAVNRATAGPHTVSEDDPGPDYTTVIGGDCAPDGSITLAVDQHATCTITNDDQASTLTVTKIILNDDGGTSAVSDFTLRVDGVVVGSGIGKTVAPGSHTVSEDDPGAGYAAVIGGDCAPDGSITLAVDQHATCTITNDDNPPPQASPFLVSRPDDPTPDGCFVGDCSLREAVDAANAATGPTEIVLPSATYRLTIPTGGGSNPVSLYITHAVTITGAGTASTVIDGGALGTVLYVDRTDLNLSGVTITNGRGARGAIGFGSAGGVITDNVFVGNVALVGGDGAAIGGNVSSPTIERNLFRDNSCDNQSSTGVVSFYNGSLPRIANNVFVGNPCRAINISMPTSAGPTVINNTIVRNRTGIRLSACCGGLPKSFRNNLIVENEIGLDANLGDTIWEHNLVFGNGVDYLGIADQTGLNGNISVDPLFVDQAGGDFHLAVGSPAVDAGSSEGAPADDFDGKLRPVDGDHDGMALVDIGAFELQTTSLTVTKLVVNDNGGAAVAGDFTLRVDGAVVTSGVPSALAAGVYTVSEDDPGSDYVGVVGGDCAPDGSITLAVDQNAVCTITNDDVGSTLTLLPTDDATVRENRPDRNLGADEALEVDLSSRKDALLRFEVSGVGSRPVVSATLRLFVIDSSSFGGDFNLTGTTEWSEDAVTWATAPPGDGGFAGSLGRARVGDWLTLDVTAAVTGDGPLSFRVSSTSSNGVDYASKEHASGNGPQLIVELGPEPTTSQYVVTREGETYTAQSSRGTFTGTLKTVVESAVTDLKLVGGGEVIFGAGRYDLDGDHFEFAGVNDITFSGAGSDETFLQNFVSEDADSTLFDFVASDRIVIRNLEVIAGGFPRKNSDAIRFRGGDDNLIDGVSVESFRGRGIVFDGTNNDGGGTALRNVIRNCFISPAQGSGIELLASSGNRIEGCTVAVTGGHGIHLNKSLPTDARPNEPSSDNELTGNWIVEAGADGINITGGSNNQMLSNSILNSAQIVAGSDGIRIQSSDGVACDGNVLWGNSASDDQPVKTQRYGLAIVDLLCVANEVGPNDFAGNLAGALLDGGTGTVFTDTSGPTVPANLVATEVTSSSVVLRWDASTDNYGVTGYLLYRDGALLVELGPVTEYEDFAVAPGTTYAYRVSARDGARNNSDLSNEVVVATPVLPDTEPPTAPSDLQVTDVGPNHVDLAWVAAVDDRELFENDIYRDGVLLATVGLVTTFTDLTVLPDNSYDYELGARDVAGNVSPPSNIATAVTPALDTQPPTAPSSLAVTDVGTNHVDLAWVAAVDDRELFENDIYRDGVLLATVGLVTTFTDLTVLPDSSYDYEVRARDAAGNESAPSNTATAVTPPLPPPPSTLVFAPTDDATIREGRPDRNLGLEQVIEVDLSSKKDVLFRFEVSGIGARTVVSATLRLFVVDSSDAGGNFNLTSITGWSEETVTWATAPPGDGDLLGSLGRVRSGEWVTLDLTGFVTGDGVLSFRVSSTSSNGADYASREDPGGNGPQLVLELG